MESDEVLMNIFLSGRSYELLATREDDQPGVKFAPQDAPFHTLETPGTPAKMTNRVSQRAVGAATFARKAAESNAIMKLSPAPMQFSPRVNKDGSLYQGKGEVALSIERLPDGPRKIAKKREVEAKFTERARRAGKIPILDSSPSRCVADAHPDSDASQFKGLSDVEEELPIHGSMAQRIRNNQLANMESDEDEGDVVVQPERRRQRAPPSNRLSTGVGEDSNDRSRSETVVGTRVSDSAVPESARAKKPTATKPARAKRGRAQRAAPKASGSGSRTASTKASNKRSAPTKAEATSKKPRLKLNLKGAEQVDAGDMQEDEQGVAGVAPGRRASSRRAPAKPPVQQEHTEISSTEESSMEGICSNIACRCCQLRGA